MFTNQGTSRNSENPKKHTKQQTTNNISESLNNRSLRKKQYTQGNLKDITLCYLEPSFNVISSDSYTQK